MHIFSNEPGLAAAVDGRPGANELPPPGPGRLWVWATLACLLFGASGAIRSWQDRRFDQAKNRVVSPLFPLKTLPNVVGSWRVMSGVEATLDPQIARIAGSSDSLIRTYTDEATGVVLTVLVLFGRAEQVISHTPEVCYPAVGFEQAGEAIDLPVRGGAVAAVFRSLVYSRGGSEGVGFEEVSYGFRHENRWTPEVEGNWRVMRNSPPVFKVQIRRRTASRESRGVNNPIEQFLAGFLPEIEQRVAASSARPAGAAG